MPGESTDFHKLVARFTREVRENKHPDYGNVAWCPYCPGNGYSMNEIWRQAYLAPPSGYFIQEDSGPFRAAYDYGEPAGLPSKDDPHSTLPGDWGFNDQNQPVSYLPLEEGTSVVRKQTEKKHSHD